MAILINFKICDNVKDCGGIEACPTNAIYWDDKDKKIKIDNSKCTSCAICVPACPVEAIRVAKTDEEYKKIKQEIKEDPRRISDLFVDRYGAMPIDPDTLIKEIDFENKVLKLTKPVLIEFFKDESIECLRNSIPIKELIPRQDIVFKKLKVKEDDKLVKTYEINNFPCLLLFNKEKLIGKIRGYYGRDKEKELREKLKKLIKT